MEECIRKGDPVFLGKKLREMISQRGYRQVAFAKMMGISASRLSNYLNGSRLPDFFTLCRMADLLCVSVSDFSDGGSGRNNSAEYIITVSGGSIVSVKRLGLYQETVS